MNAVTERVSQKRERVQRVLMIWGAVVLFALGLLLLLAPARGREDGHQSRAGDNWMHGSTAREHCKSGWHCA